MRSSLSALEQYLAQHESEIEEPRQSLGSGYVRNKKTNGVSISFDRDDIVESNAYKVTSHGYLPHHVPFSYFILLFILIH